MARESWGSRVGFVLAAVGSAVGLGSLWRFPYLTATNGGAAFVLVYAILLLLVGIPALLAEFLIGREGRTSPWAAYRKAAGWAGWLGPVVTVSSLVFLSYYSVLTGWTVSLLGRALTGAGAAAVGDSFLEISEGPDAMAAHALVVGAAILVVARGIRKGLERVNFVLMPLLALLLVGLSIWAQTLPGSADGRTFYLRPEPAEFDFDTLRAAAGQVFFAVGLGLGTMVAYSSYLARDAPVTSNAAIICLSVLVVPFLAGLMIFPMVFGLGIQDEVLAAGENAFGVLFITLPRGFATLAEPWSTTLLLLFLLTAFVAAFTSVISVLEVSVAGLAERWKLPRPKAALLAGLVVYEIGILPGLRLSAFNQMDVLASAVLLPLGALGGVATVAWGLKKAGNHALPGRPRAAGALQNYWRWAILPLLAAIVVVGLRSLLP